MSSTSHSIEPFDDVNLNKEQVFAMCRQYRILPQHYRCFWRLVARCEINSDDFGRRIVFQKNYKRLTDKILAIVDGVA